MKIKYILCIILVLSLTSCASVKITSPTTHLFENSKTFQASYEDIWVRAVDWFADHNVTIEKIEKPSGLLTAKYYIEVNDKYLDCGEFKASGTASQPRIEKLGSLNVTVRRLSENETKVNVNFFGEYKMRANDWFNGGYVYSNGSCTSSGNLEKNILEYIGS